MSRLSKLYDAMQTLRNEGLALEDIENQVSQLEEEIIQKEILPIVTESIAPALKDVQREQSEGKLLRPNKVLLVSNTIDAKYRTSQKPIKSNGIEWYVMTCSDTPQKKKQIEEIARVLGMKINVEIV